MQKFIFNTFKRQLLWLVIYIGFCEKDSGLHCVIFLAYTFFYFLFFILFYEITRLWLISLCDYVTLFNLPYHMIAYDNRYIHKNEQKFLNCISFKATVLEYLDLLCMNYSRVFVFFLYTVNSFLWPWKSESKHHFNLIQDGLF